MPSENRLHPLSFLFHLGGQLQQLVIPFVLVLVGAGTAGVGSAWVVPFLVVYALVAILRCLSYRYRFDDSELVITTGFIFRNERHVPYARIHNIDAVQNIAHRALKVVEVRVETGGGDEPEATLRVLPFGALAEMRERVFAGRTPAAASAPDAAAPPRPEARTLLELRPRELLLAGFIDSRGLVIIAGAFGLLWEFGLFDSAMDRIFGDAVNGRGLVRQFFRAVAGGGLPPLNRILFAIAAFVVFLIVIRLLSMGWSFIRLHGFRLDRIGDDLRAEFGLFTRIMATIPLTRIQTLTIREGPLHRFFRTASVRVDSAGGSGPRTAAAKRESLAPIIRSSDVDRLLREVLPEVDFAAIEWRPVDPRGFRRALKAALIFYTALTVPFVLMLKWWTFALLAALASWAYFDVKMHIKHLGWATADRAVLYRSGWLFRQLTVARFTKIQIVTIGESPFDRRHRMASVHVDTAGASDASHRIRIPYLARATADDLFRRLAGEAARTSFRW
ncbi:MAG TPA: PH domain-containing protein [Vicinamibacterales bacterium]|jgi:putative membrane protein